MTTPERITDKYGEWLVYPGGMRAMIPGTETQLWCDEHPAPEPSDEPDPNPALTVWDEIAAAYQEGVNSIDE